MGDSSAATYGDAVQSNPESGVKQGGDQRSGSGSMTQSSCAWQGL